MDKFDDGRDSLEITPLLRFFFVIMGFIFVSPVFITMIMFFAD